MAGVVQDRPGAHDFATWNCRGWDYFRETRAVWKCLLLGMLVLPLPLGCGERKLSPEEILARQEVARAYVVAQLVDLESKEKKAPLVNLSHVVIAHTRMSAYPYVTSRGLKVFFEKGVPVKVSAIHPIRYEEGHCDRSETVDLHPEEAEAFARLIDFYFSKQYGPWGIETSIGGVTFEVIWYDADGNEYVRSSVPDDWDGNSDAIRILKESFTPRCVTIPTLLDSLQDEEACMRNFALNYIEERVRADRKYLATSDEAVPALLLSLEDAELSIRIEAARCLYMLFDEKHAYSKQATDALLHVAKTGDRWERSRAVSALSSDSATKSDEVVDLLLVALDDEYDGVRAHAVGALAKCKDVPGRDGEIIDALKDALDDEGKSVRYHAVGALLSYTDVPGRNGEIVDALKVMLDDENEEVQTQVERVLKEITGN